MMKNGQESNNDSTVIATAPQSYAIKTTAAANSTQCCSKKEKKNQEEEEQKQQQQVLHLNDVIMEAMILLDPPPITVKTASSEATEVHTGSTAATMTISNVRKAYDMLVSWSNKNNNKSENGEEEHNGEKDGCDDLNYTFYEKVLQLSDLYRAMIVSSVLLLEMTAAEDEEYHHRRHHHRHANEEEEEKYDDDDECWKTKSNIQMMLCQTIQRSILLLQKIGFIYFLATSNSTTNDMNDANNFKSNDAYSSSSFQSASITQSKRNNRHNYKEKKQIILSMMKQYEHLQQQQQQQQSSSDTCNHNNTNITAATSTYNMNIEWHDILLPKSQHPLLQESFHRKEFMDVESGFIFGYDERLISLCLHDYEYYPYHHDDAAAAAAAAAAADDGGGDVYNVSTIQEQNNANGQVYFDKSNAQMNHHQQDVRYYSSNSNYSNNNASDGHDHDISQHLSLSLNIKEIEKEEEMLLNIAFPDDQNNSSRSQRNGRKYNRKNNSAATSKNSRKRQRNQDYFTHKDANHQPCAHYQRGNNFFSTKSHSKKFPSPLPTEFLDTCQKNDILKYIQLPFTSSKTLQTLQTYPIMKQGWLLQSTSNMSQKCYARIFNNGIIILSIMDDDSSNKEGEACCTGNIFVYELGDTMSPMKCTSMSYKDVFHFLVGPVVQKMIVSYHSDDNDVMHINEPTSILKFATYQEHGKNNVMEALKWMTTIDECAEIKGAMQYLNNAIKEYWI